MRLRKIFLPAFTALICFAIPATASADNYCVGTSPACTGSPLSFDRQGVLDAVTAANNRVGTDKIYIAEGTIDLTATLQASTTPGGTVEIIGAGVGKTIFNGTVASSQQIDWDFGDSTSSASGFSIEVNGAVNGGSGMLLQRGTVEDAEIIEGQAANSGYVGVSLLNGAKLQGVSIETASSASNGVFATTGPATLTNVTIDGAGSNTGVYLSASAAATFDLSQVRISGFVNGVYMTSGNVNLNDSLIDIGDAASGTGFYGYSGSSATVPIIASVNRVTIVGSGTNQRGMQFSGVAPSGHFEGAFNDMLIYGGGSGFVGQLCSQGASPGNPSWGYNDVVATNGPINSSANCLPDPGTVIDLAANLPEFRDFAGGDYRLKWNSPLIDVGTSTGALDLAGNTRVVDGDGDGTATVDIGAYEYQRQAPVAALSAAKETLGLLEATTFTGTASDADDESLTYSWKVDGSPAVGTGTTLSIGFIAAGQHAVTFTAADESGLDTSASVTVNVQNPVTNPPPPVAAKPTAKVAAKAKKAFGIGRKGFAAPKKKQPFFTVTFADSAKAKFTLQSIGKNKKLKAVRGSQTMAVKPGANKFAFNGKFGGKKLKAGRYRVTVTPLAADGKAGQSVTIVIALR